MRNLMNQTRTPITWPIRLAVGFIFFSEGIQKFLYPYLVGSGRFEKIGLPMAQALGPFVGSIEILCGVLILIGLFTRLAAVPLIIVILTAIISTKVPILIENGFWKMAHEARTDYSMLLSLIFLLINGSGGFSMDRKFGVITN